VAEQEIASGINSIKEEVIRRRTLRDAVIISAVRTPVGRYMGALKDAQAYDLAATALKMALRIKRNHGTLSSCRTKRGRAVKRTAHPICSSGILRVRPTICE